MIRGCISPTKRFQFVKDWRIENKVQHFYGASVVCAVSLTCSIIFYLHHRLPGKEGGDGGEGEGHGKTEEISQDKLYENKTGKGSITQETNRGKTK